jgi:hypothetical protein
LPVAAHNKLFDEEKRTGVHNCISRQIPIDISTQLRKLFKMEVIMKKEGGSGRRQ